MIKDLELTDFQAHKKSNLNFENGINIIIGQSDNGKSSIIRALNWVVNNKPNGDSFIRNGQEQSIVKVNLNNSSIIRVKDKKNNYYEIDGNKLEAFGQNVPDEVENVFNFTDVNLQKQFDTSFLISDTPGEIAKKLNKVIDLEIIGESLSNIESMRRKENREIDLCKSEMTRLKKDLENYEWLDNFEHKIIAAKDIESNLQKRLESKNKLNKLIVNTIDINFSFNSIKCIIKFKPKVEELEALSLDLKNKKDNIFILEKAFAEGFFVEDEIKSLQGMIKNRKAICKIDSDYDKLRIIQTDYTNIKSIISNIKESKETIKNAAEEIKVLKQELNEILPDICPLCNNKINKDNV